jgi:hypothetical protein
LLFNWSIDFPLTYSIYIIKNLAPKSNTACCAEELWHLIIFCCNKPSPQAFLFEDTNWKHKQGVQLLFPLSTK